VAQIQRPAADYVADKDLQKIVHCEQCDETFIKMFRKDHKCDEKKLEKMLKNNRGDFADPLLAFKGKLVASANPAVEEGAGASNK